MTDDDLIRRGDALAAAADLYRWSIAAGEELEAAIAALPAVTVGAPDVCAEALSDMARDDAPLIRAILPAMTPEVRELVREKDALRLQRAAMHRRAQRAEGKAHRSAHLLETILRSIKEALPMLPTLPSPYPLSLHSLYHRVRAARDHARASSGRALVENWHIWRRYYDEEKARTERLEALLREAQGRIEALENEAVLSRAAYEGVSSLLLSVQQDCIKERQRAERLEAALRKLHHAVCGETGFAACVRLDSGKAYPWPALDEADAAVRAALKGADHE